MGSLSLRVRVALLVAGATAMAMIAAGVGSWFVARNQLLGTVDDELDRRAVIATRVGEIPPRGGRLLFGLDDTVVQEIDASGRIVGSPPLVELPVPEAAIDVAAGRAGLTRYDATVHDAHVRVLVVGVGPGRATMLARSLAQVDDSLSGLRRILFGAGVAGTVLAGAAGFVFARRSLRPVEELTRVAEHVAETQELDAELAVPADRADEIGRLASSFEKMLTALEASRRQQQQLVDDASHELRTPLTSLRTNVELLQRTPTAGLDDDQRREILDDVLAELDELGGLVTELVELATDQRQAGPPVELDLGSLTEAVVERHRRRTHLELVLSIADPGSVDPGSVEADAALVERAVSNLVDNAIKWSPEDGRIEVSVRGGLVTVRDFGPGIAPADREHVFDRFWRSEEARGRPGSGLGLSIVRKVADAYDGRTWVTDPADGGPGTVAALDLSPAPD